MNLMASKYDFRFDEKNGYVVTDYRGRKVGSFKKTFDAWMNEAGVIRYMGILSARTRGAKRLHSPVNPVTDLFEIEPPTTPSRSWASCTCLAVAWA